MKYREDMVYNVAECPVMCSDRPGTTTKVPPLEIFLRERELWLLDEVCAVWWGSERDTHYKSSLADPTNLSKRGPSAFPWWTVYLWKKSDPHPTRTASVQFFSPTADRPRTFGGSSATCSVDNPSVYPKLAG